VGRIQTSAVKVSLKHYLQQQKNTGEKCPSWKTEVNKCVTCIQRTHMRPVKPTQQLHVTSTIRNLQDNKISSNFKIKSQGNKNSKELPDHKKQQNAEM
jgi:hypothetical protein